MNASRDSGNGERTCCKEHGESSLLPVHCRMLTDVCGYVRRILGLRVLHLVLFAQQRQGSSLGEGISQHFHLPIFASPMYEYMDTCFGITGSAMKFQNSSFRILVRGGYLTVNTLVVALLPFLGDFESLTGAISMFPLMFILANHMYLMAKQNKMSSLQKSWHWLNVCFFGCMSVAGAIVALRLIAVDSKTYNLFADS